jgi:hypothetical protein
MSAPKRWLADGGGATRGERDLLRLGAAHEPPPSAKDAVWIALLAKLPPIPPGGGGGGGAAGGAKAAASAKAAGAAGAASGGGSAAVAAAVGGGLLKSALIGAGSAVALIAAYTVVTPSQAPSVPAPAVVETSAGPQRGSLAEPKAAQGGPATPILPARNIPEIQGSAAMADSTAPPGAASAAPIEARAGSSAPLGREARGPFGSNGANGSAPGQAAPALERETPALEESRRLAEARDALRRGDSAGALSRLTDLQRAVPGGILGQEREALAIEALAKSGRASEAQARARAFLQAYPQSPHAARIEAFAR